MKSFVKVIALFAVLAILCVPAFAQDGPRQLTWTGDVDDTVIVYVHGDNVAARTIRGKDTTNINVDFAGRLPHRPVQVFISDWSGRGSVRVVQQPDPYNDYTAAIRIHDPQPGRDQYTFTLNWRPLDFSAPMPTQ